MPRKRQRKRFDYQAFARSLMDGLQLEKPLTLEEENRLADKKYYDYLRSIGQQEIADYYEPITAELWYNNED